MAINLYIGQSRSGKSYEVVTYVIVEALRIGRRVVSNIGGLNYEAMKQHLISQGVEESKIGQLLQVTNEQVSEPYFFKTDYDEKAGRETTVQSGDLVALDEIWRFWKKRGEIPERHLNFFRMHGHFVNQVNQLTCEVVLITQAIRDVNESIRDNAHQTFVMKKLTKLGMSNRYTVDIFDRGQTTKSAHILQLAPRVYNPEFFKFYKSHTQNDSGVSAKEIHTDKRGNILKSKIFYILPFIFLLMFFAVRFVWGFLHPEVKNDKTINTVSTPSITPQNSPNVSPASNYSESWKIKGYYLANNLVHLILINSDGAYRHFVTNQIAVTGLDIQSKIDDELINNWVVKNTKQGGLIQ